MVSELYNKINYTSDYTYIISRYIREYDISKANINILLSLGYINMDQYTYLYNTDRMNRQIQIGLMLQGNKQMSEDLKRGVIEAKRNFFESNNIQDNEVLEIKNDAIFLIDKIAYDTVFGNVEFKNKNTYTSYYRLPFNDIRLYYYLDNVNSIETLDVKGIKPQQCVLHKDHFIDFLKTLMYTAECEGIEETVKLLSKFYNDYISLNLDVNYYRRFDSESTISIKPLSSMYSFIADYVDDINKQHIDISHNLNILRYFHQIYSGLLFSRKI